MTRRQPIDQGWSLAVGNGSAVPTNVAGRRVPATVPGCVHTDLLAAGLIPDPYHGDNEAQLGWIGESDWSYRTTFSWTDEGDDRVDLVCDGLDTVATVILNGVEIGQAANMHRSHRFDVRDLLRPGDNSLTVDFASPLRYARGFPDLPHGYDKPYNQIRKMACNFGWDWGPALVTSGIWRPIALQSWSVARLDNVRPLVSRNGRVEVRADVAWAGHEPLLLTATVGGVAVQVAVAPGTPHVEAGLTVPDPAIWWPRGYGDQPLYDLEVTLATSDGRALDRWQRRIGFRSVVLDTTPDEDGSAYTLVVNDLPVFVKGVNWIPDDCFPSRLTRERYAHRLRQACEAGVNYLRVWGGGIYESDDFYDVADELGLLVGQDFLFACAAYSEEEPLHGEVAAEAREQVVRLASHPSLVTWTGNNECVWGFHDWGWREQLADRTWGAGYYFDLLPKTVAELDPTRPYWPGSPYAGDPDIYPNEPGHGSTHQWDVWWKDPDYAGYRASVPRFVAEFGFQGPANWSTMQHGYHQKAADGDAKIAAALEAYMPPHRDEDDWHYLAQLNQARAISLGIEHFRSHRGRCMGTVVWQLNDCWPVVSWAAIDGEGRHKPLWYALRHSYAPRLLTFQPRGDTVALIAVNDGIDTWQEEVVVRRIALDGTELAAIRLEIDAPANSALTLELPAAVATPGDERTELLVAGGVWWTYVSDRDIAYPKAGYDAVVESAPDGTRVVVTARTLLRDLTLFPDRLDPSASVDTAMVNLLPGETASFTIRSDRPLEAAELTTRPVLRCLNDLR
ncbi:glycoside hydrolase family 2 protein [Kribbella sp. NPDC050281]|uniref:glycoside hydrolase family 2 protein n=1 Tax=Kribbella sp. NPDC050281 TaxID=3155515 RepID=UPI0033F3CA84